MASPVKDAKAHHQGRGFTQVHSRGRGHLVSRKPGTDQYAITTQVGGRGWHRGPGPYDASHEVDTAWQVGSGAWEYEMTLGDPYQAYIDTTQRTYRYEDMASGEWVELSVNAIEWVNDTGDSESAATLSPPAISINDDTISFGGLFGAGSNLDVQAQTARLKKVLTLDNDTVLSTPTLSGVVSLSYSLRFQRSNGVSVWVDGVQWNEKGNNPQLTGAAVEFKDAGDVTLFGFKVPYAEDANETRQDGTMYLRKTGANLFVEVRIPHAWMLGATYPIEIDPTVDELVGAGADDAHEKYDDTTFSSSATQVLLSSDTATNRWNGGFRFQTVAISDTIDAAYFEAFFYNPSNDRPNSDLYAEDVDDAADFSTTADVTSRTKTTANVQWGDTTDVGHNAFWGSTVEIKTVIQEIMDRGGWASGQDIVILLFGRSDAASNCIASSYERNTAQAAKLHVEYTAAGGGGNPWYAYAQQ